MRKATRNRRVCPGFGSWFTISKVFGARKVVLVRDPSLEVRGDPDIQLGEYPLFESTFDDKMQISAYLPNIPPRASVRFEAERNVEMSLECEEGTYA
jgi:hypothetical protein